MDSHSKSCKPGKCPTSYVCRRKTKRCEPNKRTNANSRKIQKSWAQKKMNENVLEKHNSNNHTKQTNARIKKMDRKRIYTQLLKKIIEEEKELKPYVKMLNKQEKKEYNQYADDIYNKFVVYDFETTGKKNDEKQEMIRNAYMNDVYYPMCKKPTNLDTNLDKAKRYHGLMIIHEQMTLYKSNYINKENDEEINNIINACSWMIN